METLLPSEIARLVLGYLEDQKCTEAAKLFLETSPHLQECRTVLSFGRRFSTRVSGLTLMDIVEKFSAISTMIQERLNKVTHCEQLKHCADLMEQLKFLVEEPRGQRFVVNINVPSQNSTQASNSSPIIASNMRKRRHSNSERVKRTVKSQSNTVQQLDAITSPSASCHNVDTTPLESLPGNTSLLKQMESNNVSEKEDDNVTQELHSQCDYDKNDSTTICSRSNSIRRSLDNCNHVWNTQNCETDADDKRKEENKATNMVLLKQCSTATNTEKLSNFSVAEVQTSPYEIPESEFESNAEPIENLSILTKELLNRTELQECIAENINKAIIPTDLSLREESLNDSVGGEGNTSIMAELNTAIKSIVEATETDPVFEKFLDEIIGPHTETDTSPEEDVEGKASPKSLNELQEKQAEADLSNISSPEPIIMDTRTSTENIADIPLKHRLRSSSRQQYNRNEDEVDKTKDPEKEQNALEDQNAAAVLSIINANITNTTSIDKKTLDDAKESTIASNDNKQKMQTMIIGTANKHDITLKTLTSANIQKSTSNVAPSTNNMESRIKKSTVKRPRPTKPKRLGQIETHRIDRPMNEQDIITMPTLIVCSKEEMNNLLTINRSSTIRSTSTSRFIPIAPKDPNRVEESVETLYLRAVNVAHEVAPVAKTLPTVIEEQDNPASQILLQSEKKIAKVNKKLKTVHKVDTVYRANTRAPTVEQQILDQMEPIRDAKIIESESITLYGNENCAKTSLEGTNMPMINLEENISLSESGLSPYLKFNSSKTNQNHNLSDIDLTPMMECAKNTTTNNDITEQQLTVSTKNVDSDTIAKRTPKSLLKSRSKNSRLSLSTPRKRSTHIRALDFSTPPKVIGSARRANGKDTTQFSSSSTKRLKSICRTSLFKSPPFSHSSTIITQKQKSPMKICQSYKIPIATRSPTPKLMGDWDKYNGVGVIIGDMSPHGSTSASSSSDDKTQHKISKAGNWDADLRKSIQLNEKNETETKKPAKKKVSIKNKNDIICKRDKFNPRSVKSDDKEKVCEANREPGQRMEDTNRLEENCQSNMEVATTENHRAIIITEPRNNCEYKKENVMEIAANDFANKTVKILEPADTQKISIKTENTNILTNTVAEKKPIKKYVQLKTIRTNLKNSNNENKKNTENVQISSQVSELPKVISMDSTQLILRMPDMIDLDTPRKFHGNRSDIPPTPRMLSPNNNAITPFIKLNEDSSRIRSFISTPEFPTTPCIALTPKLTEETTRDVVKRSDYNSPYYKPISEQASEGPHKISKSNQSIQESPILSSSHTKLHSTHDCLTSSNTYQTCTSSKLEITQFEVIKENLPKEEAIKELKIASSSKDSASATEVNPSVVAIDHTNLIQINEFKGVNKHCKTITDDNYDENDKSSSSGISTSSDSSSSSTSTTDSSISNSSSGKHDSASKIINTHEGTKVIMENDVQANMPSGTCNKLDNVSAEPESSPKKVFAIAKTDDQIEATLKETPAKDENLLNEADISETPSGSKSGVENLTNLSTKISAMITEDEELSKLQKLPRDDSKIVNRPRLKPKIINIQYIRPESSTTTEDLITYAKDKCQFEQEQDTSVHNELTVQLEEKRQRMIAKFRDIPKSNLSNGRTHKRILAGKVSDNRRKGAQLGGKRQNQRSTRQYSYKKKIDRDYSQNTVSHSIPQENSTINTRKRYEMQEQSFTNEHYDNKEGMKKQISASRDTDPSLTNCENNSNIVSNDHSMKQSHINTICNMGNNLVENVNKEDTQSHKISSSENQNYLKEELENTKKNMVKSCHTEDDIVKEDTKETLKDSNISEKEIKPVEKCVIIQETLASDKTKQEINDQMEDKTNKTRQFINYADKSKCILKCKVDQVKRDLFSDEENDQKAYAVVNSKDDKTKKIISAETQDSDHVEAPSTRENAEDPKEELTVLECLQLVPAHKNDHAHDEENQTKKQQQERNECKINEVDNESNQITSIHNYKAEYHFIYDDSVPIRKRRRRYSAHDLQIEINYADLSDPDSVECTKLMKATDFEEIFNLPPKSLSKKRTLTKKTSNKNEKTSKVHKPKTDNDVLNLKDDTVKPLATSSPLDESSAVKKKMIKTNAVNINSVDTQVDIKKKSRIDKTQERDITAKNRKRKLSESKEMKQNEKRSCTTDPQTLLNNVDLDKFLSAVHGPN